MIEKVNMWEYLGVHPDDEDEDPYGETAFCPKCNTELENYSHIEGGWCPKCEEWFPDDIIREAEVANR